LYPLVVVEEVVDLHRLVTPQMVDLVVVVNGQVITIQPVVQGHLDKDTLVVVHHQVQLTQL
tara:strand:- start:289 stop:471 length:183 start_codon:yes stop_codon:yes gene_type:complete